MMSTIFFKELQYNLLNTRLMITWGILIFLFVASAFVVTFSTIENNKGIIQIEQQNRKKLTYDEKSGIIFELYARFFNQPYEKRNGLSQILFMPQRLVKKGGTLSFISGSGKNIPDGSNVEYFKQPAVTSNHSTNIYMDAFYALNWSRIFIYILSFIIICFSFSAFSGEKGQGTLKLMLTNRVSRLSIILGKYLGLLVTFLVPFIVGVLVVLVFIMINSNLHFYEGDFFKLTLFMVLGIVFLSINILLGYLISCLSRTSAVSLSVSLIVWAILAIIFPNVSWLGVDKIKPIPTIADVNDEIKNLQNDLQDCFTGWSHSWIGKAPNEQVKMRKECSDRKTKIENEVWRDYYKKLFSQTETAIAIASLSPFSSFQFACDKITDSGYFGYKSFYGQVLEYQQEFKRFVQEKDKSDKNSYHLIWNEFYTKDFMSAKKIDGAEVPQFEYKPSLFKSVLKKSAWNIIYLMVWVVCLFVGVFIAFVRYDDVR